VHPAQQRRRLGDRAPGWAAWITGGSTICVAGGRDELLPALRIEPQSGGEQFEVNRGVRRLPDSNAVMAAGLRPARAASCSCVSPAATRTRTSTAPNGAGSCFVVVVVFTLPGRPSRIV